MVFVEFPQESWTVAINPHQVVMISPLTDRRRTDPRTFSRLSAVPEKTVITLCSPLEDGAFWITVDMPYSHALQLLSEAA